MICRGALIGLAALAMLHQAQAPAPARLGDVPASPNQPAEPTQPAYSLSQGDTVRPCPGWPVWLKDFHRGARTEKTSAIAFAGRDPQGRRCFFLADEIGQLHFCSVNQVGDSGAVDISLEVVGTGPHLLEDLPLDRPWDFEGLDLDLPPRGAAGGRGSMGQAWSVPDSVDGLLSIEGHGSTAEDDTRLLAIRLRSERVTSPGGARWHLESLGDAIPNAHFWRGQIKSDVGFEGVAISPGYYWFGLESLDERGELNTRGSVLYIYDRAAAQIGTLPTKGWGIYTICGLAAPSDTVTVVADRSRQSLFIMRWAAGSPGQLLAAHRVPLDLPAPGGFRYAIPTVEGVTVDDGGDIWCVIDPWRGHYQPVGAAPESVHVYLAAEIPMLYRFAGSDIWPAAGLGGLWAPVLGRSDPPEQPDRARPPLKQAGDGDSGDPQGGRQ
jgi:hypothetical protein